MYLATVCHLHQLPFKLGLNCCFLGQILNGSEGEIFGLSKMNFRNCGTGKVFTMGMFLAVTETRDGLSDREGECVLVGLGRFQLLAEVTVTEIEVFRERIEQDRDTGEETKRTVF